VYDIYSDIYFFAPTNNICSHGLPISPFVNLKRTFQKWTFQKWNLKSHRLPTIFHLFSYIKREVRKRWKRERRELVEIKIKIRPSQLQTVITFDRKLRFRRFTRSQKANDEIYKVNRLRHYHHFLGKKNLVFKLKNPFEVFLRSFMFFFLEMVYLFILLYEKDVCIFSINIFSFDE
jgi:hypothetical protein